MKRNFVSEYIEILKELHPAYLIATKLEIFKYRFKFIDFEFICNRICSIINNISKETNLNESIKIILLRDLQLLLFDFSEYTIQNYDFEYYIESHFDAIVVYLEDKKEINHLDFFYLSKEFHNILNYIEYKVSVTEINSFVFKKYLWLIERCFKRIDNIFFGMNIDKKEIELLKRKLYKFINSKYILINFKKNIEFSSCKYEQYFKIYTMVNCKVEDVEQYFLYNIKNRFNMEFILCIDKWCDIKNIMPFKQVIEPYSNLKYSKIFGHNYIGKLYSNNKIISEKSIEFMHEIYPGHHYMHYLQLRDFPEYKFLNNIFFDEGWSMFIEYCCNKKSFYYRYRKFVISSLVSIYVNKYNLLPDEIYQKIILDYGKDIIQLYNIKNIIANAFTSRIQSVHYVLGFEMIYEYFKKSNMVYINNKDIERLSENRFDIIMKFVRNFKKYDFNK